MALLGEPPSERRHRILKFARYLLIYSFIIITFVPTVYYNILVPLSTTGVTIHVFRNGEKVRQRLTPLSYLGPLRETYSRLE